MSDIPTLDKIHWHAAHARLSNGAEKQNLGVHIGMFVAWCVLRDHWSPKLLAEMQPAISQLKDRKMTGLEFLLEYCGATFVVELLNKEGGAFAAARYETYLKLFKRTLAASLESEYLVEDTWTNYDLLAPHIDKEFQEWKHPKWWKIF
jgi:hypothetical protein